MAPGLSVKRKADRAEMVAALVETAEKYGVPVEVVDPAPLSPRGVRVTFKCPRGLSVTVHIDGGTSQPDAFFLPWHILGRAGENAILTDRFGREQGSTVNPHHRAKCTAYGEGWTAFLALLERGLAMAADGSAFESAEVTAAFHAAAKRRYDDMIERSKKGVT